MVAGVGTLAPAPPLAAGITGCSTVAATATTVAGAATLPANPQGTGGTTGTNGGDVGPTRSRSGENRRSNKPIMEKRRRARINNCLNELKTLILDAMKKDPARHSKLEKADILEMTVKHLETLQRQQVAMAAATDPNVANKFRAGFTECAGEVGRFPGLEGPVKRRLLQHLANCLNNSSPTQSSTTTTSPVTPAPTEHTTTTHPVQVHILRTPDSNIIQGLQLVPTRLPNGDIALILPTTRATPVSSSPSSPSPSISSSSSGSSPLPMLIPIPNRTTGNSPSPDAFDRLSLANNQSVQTVTVINPSSHPTPSIVPLTAHSEPDDRRLVVNEGYVDPNRNTYSPDKDEPGISQRLVINEDYEVEDSRMHYGGDRETILHIPERDYYDDSFDDSETEYYSQQIPRPYSPELQAPLALVTRKRCEEREDQPWRPW